MYGYRTATPIKGWIIRGDFIYLPPPWLFEADLQIHEHKNGHQSNLERLSVGFRPVQISKYPAFWGTVEALRCTKLPYILEKNDDVAGLGMGFQTILPLTGVFNGQARFSLAWLPLQSVLYKSMDLGWNIGSIGLRVGGIGLRTPEGRLFSSLTMDITKRW
jgi:hypothetical protein